MIERQREITNENAELRERLKVKEMQINQIRSDKEELIEESNYRNELKKIADEDHDRLVNLLKLKLEKNEENFNSLLGKFQTLQLNFSKATNQIENLNEKIKFFEEKLKEKEKEISLVNSENEIQKREFEILKERMEGEIKNHVIDVSEIILYKKRLQISNDQLKAIRKEMNSKDNYIHLLHEKLDQFQRSSNNNNINNNIDHNNNNNNNNGNNNGNNDQWNESKKIKMINFDLQRVTKEMEMAKEGQRAHQQQNSFLSSEVLFFFSFFIIYFYFFLLFFNFLLFY